MRTRFARCARGRRKAALILHELATNATKYGALSRPAGRIDIAWRLDEAVAAEPQFSMIWKEQDGPPVEVAQKRGFGRTFIEASAKATLKGEAAFDYAPDGFCFRLLAPAGNVLEANSVRADELPLQVE